jgi:hypothetical protein
MIDNITLYKKIEIPSLDNFYHHVKSKGATSFKFISSEFGDTLKFNHKNLEFNAGKKHLKVVGSITKWYCGENISTLGLHDCQVAFNELSIFLGIDLADFEVQSLEFAANLIMREQPKKYFDFLGAHSKLKKRRIESDTTLYYKGPKGWGIKFYDKLAHARSKGNRMPIHHVLQNKNILRYEITFKGRLDTQLKFENTLSQLLKPENYALVLNRWYNEYKTINKVGVEQYTSNFTTPSQFEDFMVVTACHHLGQGIVYKLIEDAVENKAISSQSKRRMRKTVNEAYQKQPHNPFFDQSGIANPTNDTIVNQPTLESCNSLACELDSRMENVFNSQNLRILI